MATYPIVEQNALRTAGDAMGDNVITMLPGIVRRVYGPNDQSGVYGFYVEDEASEITYAIIAYTKDNERIRLKEVRPRRAFTNRALIRSAVVGDPCIVFLRRLGDRIDAFFDLREQPVLHDCTNAPIDDPDWGIAQ